MGLICLPVSMPARESILIRPFAEADAQTVRVVAQRDSSAVPAGSLLVGEVDGEVRAVLSLDTGDVVADPFAPSAALVDLLRTRAAQLHRERRIPPVDSPFGRLRRRPAIPWTREPSPSS
jgi:hypothetical protein